MKTLFQSSLCFLGIISSLFFLFFFPRPFIGFIPEQIANPFNSETVFFLIVGVDDAGEAGSDRTDTIMLAGMDVENSAYEIISIPRDLMISNPDKPGEKVKINAIYKNKDLDALIKVIENMMDLTLERYAVIDYSLFKYIGDLVGPVKITVDYPMYYEDVQQNLIINFEQGIHNMNGEDLLNYIRFRDDSKGDLGRIERQKNAIKMTLKSFKDKLSLDFIDKEFKNILDKMMTDFTTQDLIFLFLNFNSIDDVAFHSFPYTIASNGSIYPDETRVAILTENFKAFKKGDEKQKTGVIGVINCTEQTPRVFSILNYNILNKSGIGYFLLNEQLESQLSEKISQNTIMLFDQSKKDYNLAISEKFKELYGSDFEIIYTENMENLSFYYQTINYLTSSKQFFPTPLEGLVFIKHQ